MKQLKGKAAVITGAASGFGLELARLAAAEGMQVVLADIEAQALARAEAEISALGAQTLAFRLDVSKGAEVQALADATLARFGVPGLVFNNAGVGAGGLVWENSEADWHWLLGVNLMGVAHGVRIFTPLMLQAARLDPTYEGHIVNTASMAGMQSAPTLGLYNTSKFAVVGLTETLHHDLALVTGQVSASVLCPALVNTGIGRSERNREGAPAGGSALTASQRVGQQLTEQGMAMSKVSAADVAAEVMQAVRAQRFYIFTHPEALLNVRTRADDILQGRQPSDPFADLPGVTDYLKARLGAAA